MPQREGVPGIELSSNAIFVDLQTRIQNNQVYARLGTEFSLTAAPTPFDGLSQLITSHDIG